MQIFAQRLIGARNRNGLSQQELADAIGKSLRSIQNWEGEVGEPHPQALRKLAETLGVSIPYLLGSDEVDRVEPIAEVPPQWNAGSIREKCVNHIDMFLLAHRDDPDKQAWTFIELKRNFPLPNSATERAEDRILSDTLRESRGEKTPGEARSANTSGTDSLTGRVADPASTDPTPAPGSKAK